MTPEYLADLKYIDALCVDTNGKLRGKRMPIVEVEKLEKGHLNIPQAIFSLSVNGEALDGGGRGISDGDPDGYCYPVKSTFASVPWSKERTGQVLVGMRDANGLAVDIDPRQVLSVAATRLERLGYWPIVAFELEFFLLKRDATIDEANPPRPVSTKNLANGIYGQSYGMDALTQHEGLLETISEYARAMSVPTRSISAESGVGQFEINLSHVPDPMLAADHAVLLRQIVKKAAAKHDLEATFMAKPFADQPGSGMHVHISLLDDNHQNVFHPRAGKSLLEQAIAGLQSLMPGCMSFFAPNVNSFRRFVPGNFVPVNRSWGYDNRSVALRIPTGDPNNTRIEHRVAGADANPLLVMASILAGLAHGIKNNLVPDAPVRGNNSAANDGALPLNFISALSLTEQDEGLAECFGGPYLRFYADLKRRELARFLNGYSLREYQWFL